MNLPRRQDGTSKEYTTSAKAAFPHSFTEGRSTEARFFQAAKDLGYQVLPATSYEDRRMHIDAWLIIGSKRLSVDIKGMKRLVRAGVLQDRYTCLEIHGAATPGWLFGGQADLVAFETRTSFLLVWRERLQVVADFIVSRDQVSKSHQAVRKLYNRRDQEQITWVETDILRDSWLLYKEIAK